MPHPPALPPHSLHLPAGAAALLLAVPPPPKGIRRDGVADAGGGVPDARDGVRTEQSSRHLCNLAAGLGSSRAAAAASATGGVRVARSVLELPLLALLARRLELLVHPKLL